MAKKRANGEGTVFKRKNGSWEAKVTVGHDPLTGRQIQRSVYAKTQREANEKRNEIVNSLQSGTYSKPSHKTVGQWLNEWYELFTVSLKMYTRRNYYSKIKNHIIPHIGAIKLEKLKTTDIQNMYNYLSLEKGLSPKTIHEIHGILHHALDKAIRINEMSKKINPCDECKENLPKVQKTEIQALENSELNSLLKVIERDEYRNLFLIDLYTGMRQGEILGLQWSCIDFKKRTIRIDKQLYKPSKGRAYTLETTKHGKTRTIMVSETVLDILKQQRKCQLQDRLHAGELWDEGEFPDLVFRNAIGGHLAHGTIYSHFKRLASSIGLKTVRFHDLRHAYAVLSLQAGDDYVTLQANLGHHSAAFTLHQYGHCTEGMRRASADRFERFINTELQMP